MGSYWKSKQMIIAFHWLISTWALLKIVFSLIKGLCFVFFFFFSPFSWQWESKKVIIERRECWLASRYWLVFVDVKSLCKAASTKHWFWEFSLFEFDPFFPFFSKLFLSTLVCWRKLALLEWLLGWILWSLMWKKNIITIGTTCPFGYIFKIRNF